MCDVPFRTQRAGYTREAIQHVRKQGQEQEYRGITTAGDHDGTILIHGLTQSFTFLQLLIYNIWFRKE